MIQSIWWDQQEVRINNLAYKIDSVLCTISTSADSDFFKFVTLTPKFLTVTIP
jgi:hypothetical protein